MRLLIVDDHASSRQPLAILLGHALDVADILQAGTAAEAMALGVVPDVAIIDLGLPDGDGIGLIHWMRGVAPDVRIVVLTGSSDRGEAARAIDAGARGVLHKAADLDEIIAAVRAIADGRSLVTERQRSDVAALKSPPRPPTSESRVRFTPRERDVLALLVAGMSDKEIAARLRIGVGTVRTHLATLYDKLDVQSRLQAVAVARKRGLINETDR